MLEYRNTITKLFYILPFGLIFNMILGWKYTAFYTPDSHGYIEIAQQLPIIKAAIFPIFYPLVLRAINTIFNNYDVAAKFLNITIIIFVLGFVKLKNFYWKEIWVMLTFSSLQSIYPMIWSENLLFALIVFYSYINYKFLSCEINSKKFFYSSSLVLFVMFTTKYNSVFFLVANVGFIIYLFQKSRKEKAVNYFISTIFSFLLCCFYLIFNYLLFDNFVGKRGVPTNFNYAEYFLASIKNIPLTYDPFSISIQRIAIKLKLLYNLQYITIAPYLISYLITTILLFKFWKLNNKKYDLITIFFLLNALVFLFLTFTSSYFTRIDIIDSRLLIVFYTFLIMGVVQFISINKICISEKYLLYVGIISLTIYLVNLIIVNFL